MDIKHIILRKQANIKIFNSIKAKLLMADLTKPAPDEFVMERLFEKWKR